MSCYGTSVLRQGAVHREEWGGGGGVTEASQSDRPDLFPLPSCLIDTGRVIGSSEPLLSVLMLHCGRAAESARAWTSPRLVIPSREFLCHLCSRHMLIPYISIPACPTITDDVDVCMCVCECVCPWVCVVLFVCPHWNVLDVVGEDLPDFSVLLGLFHQSNLTAFYILKR